MNYLSPEILLYFLSLLFTAYFIISIYKKELPVIVSINFRMRIYVFKEQKAVFVSILFILISILFLVPFLMQNFNLTYFLISFIVGVPIAFILHNFLCKISE